MKRFIILASCLTLSWALQTCVGSLFSRGLAKSSTANFKGNDQAGTEARANGRILFVSTRDGPGSEIYLMNPDGSSQLNLSNSQGEDLGPDWSPDGTRIAFASYRGGVHQKIFVMNADGTNPVQITTGASEDWGPDWSPDGSKIVFYSSFNGDGGIYVINTNGTNLTRLTNGFLDNSPVWSPDGTRIAFSNFSIATANTDIYVMDTNGSNPVNLTNHPAFETNPAWSPDGSQIVFSGTRDSLNYEIFTMNPNGTNIKRLTYNTVFDGSPSYSPDGTKIVFHRTDAFSGMNNDIFVMNAGGGDEIQLTSHIAHDLDADWQALPANAAGYLEFTSATYDVVEDIGSAIITLKRVGGSSGIVTVNYATSDGTATSGADYSASTGTITFAEGEVAKSFTVQVLNDSITEPEETVSLTLSNPTGGSGLGLSATSLLRISDIAILPVLSVGAANTTEGDTGLIDVSVTVRLSAATGKTVTVEHNTFSMTAQSGEDFQPSDGVLTFAPGETVKTVVARVIGDRLDEDDEFFRVGLSNAVNAGIAVSSNPPAITIFDDDPLPSVSIDDVVVTEGNSGITNAAFTVTLSPSSGRPVQVNYSAISGSATNPNDFQQASIMISIAPGQTSAVINISVIGEAVFEGNESFAVILTDASNANIADREGTCLILNDDSAPTISIDDVTFTEGNVGTTEAIFTVRLSAPSDFQAGCFYTTISGTATQNQDYGWVSGAAFFFPGTTTQAIQVPIIGDTLDEPNETFSVVLSDPANGSTIVKAIGLANIIDNDPPPKVSINDVSVDEGNAGSTSLVFTLSLSEPSGKSITANYSTSNVSAIAGTDYVASSGTAAFSPGQTAQQVNITVNGDTLDENEPDETFSVTLSNPVNVTIQDGQGIGTIFNYVKPLIRYAGVTYHTLEGTGNPAISILRGGSLLGSVSVDFSITDGSAQQRTDYTVISETVTFAPGETLKTVKVPISDDLYVEGTETANLILSNPEGGNLGVPNTAILNIEDNDSATATVNPLDNSDAYFFVAQHYYDFLAREADPSGLAYWTNEISSCGADLLCVNARRIRVSDAFFFEPEFQRTGGFVFRLYRAAFGNDQPFANPDELQPIEAKKLPSYAVFIRDRARVIGGPQLAQSQLALANAFVQRPDFLIRYPETLTGEQFVAAILAIIQNDSGVDLTTQQSALLNLLHENGRGAVLYRLADDNRQSNPVDNQAFIDAEYRRNFVFTEYTGYLRRDVDIDGFLFWLGQMHRFPLRDVEVQHAMVCSFITSFEYQQRFSPVVTHSNQECPQ